MLPVEGQSRGSASPSSSTRVVMMAPTLRALPALALLRVLLALPALRARTPISGGERLDSAICGGEGSRLPRAPRRLVVLVDRAMRTPRVDMLRRRMSNALALDPMPATRVGPEPRGRVCASTDSALVSASASPSPSSSASTPSALEAADGMAAVAASAAASSALRRRDALALRFLRALNSSAPSESCRVCLSQLLLQLALVLALGESDASRGPSLLVVAVVATLVGALSVSSMECCRSGSKLCTPTREPPAELPRSRFDVELERDRPPSVESRTRNPRRRSREATLLRREGAADAEADVEADADAEAEPLGGLRAP